MGVVHRLNRSAANCNVSALQLIEELGLKTDRRLGVTSRIPEPEVAALDQLAALAGVTRSRMASALLQEGVRRYAAADA